MNINAFVDNGYAPGKEFCEKFLCSNEFTVKTLQLILSSSSRLKKHELAIDIVNELEEGNITTDKILVEYVKQSRTWLSFKLGIYTNIAELKAAKSLLYEFGEPGWYGPIQDMSQSKKKWYIRTYKITDYVRRGSGSATKLDERYIRWSVVAEIGEDYVALSWDGFTYSATTDEHIEQHTQFPFWHQIPIFFNELANHCQGHWSHANLHNLILHNMWDKYLNKTINNTNYIWQHLRIRAEASGLAINAHSAGVKDIDVRGLQALSQELAHSVLNTLELTNVPEKMSTVENVILLTLIKGWGTKSYEFQLDSELTLNEIEPESEEKIKSKNYLFKAHCYFGLKPNSTTQDSLQHLKCYSYYGGSKAVLEFLLKELEFQG